MTKDAEKSDDFLRGYFAGTKVCAGAQNLHELERMHKAALGSFEDGDYGWGYMDAFRVREEQLKDPAVLEREIAMQRLMCDPRRGGLRE